MNKEIVIKWGQKNWGIAMGLEFFGWLERDENRMRSAIEGERNKDWIMCRNRKFPQFTVPKPVGVMHFIIFVFC